MEIELMEKRFRERSDRGGGGPAATGEIDGKVSDEMRAFFDESTQALQNVVPQLKEGEQGEQMLETTGEIRRKIDEFFSGVNDPNAPIGAAPESAPPAPAPRGATAAPASRGSAPAPAAGRARPPAKPEPQAATPAESAPPAAKPLDDEQMDVRTALERLRRHGGAKHGDAPRPAAQRPGSSVRSSPPAGPARGAAPSARESAPRREPPRVPPPAPQQRETPAKPGAASQRAEPQTFLPSPDETARRETQANDRSREIENLPPLTTDEIVVPKATETLRLRRVPDDVVPSAPQSPPAAQQPSAAPPKDAPAEGASFDSIFDEVQDIVLGSLKVSVSETIAAARESATELSEVAVPTAEPTSEIGPPPASQRVERLARPEEDDEEEKDEAPKGPYDWGVKPAARPPGAWLLDTSEVPPISPQAVIPDPTVTSEVMSASVAAAKNAAAAGPAASSGGGARGYLVRKAGDEVRKFQPVLRALKDAKVLDDADLGAKKEPAPATASGDDFVSAESFKDDRPSPEEIEEELSPMRLVEELRRLKRVTQALLDKGVITAEQLKKASGE
jgi:hypothetical protein